MNEILYLNLFQHSFHSFLFYTFILKLQFISLSECILNEDTNFFFALKKLFSFTRRDGVKVYN